MGLCLNQKQGLPFLSCETCPKYDTFDRSLFVALSLGFRVQFTQLITHSVLFEVNNKREGKKLKKKKIIILID